MTPTQIVRVDALSGPVTTPIRDDARQVLVVLTAGGRPIRLVRLPRPANGVLSSAAVLAQHRVAGRPPVASTKPVPLSILVCTRDRPDDLTRCLVSLRPAKAAGHDVIVIDNAPFTRRTRELADRFGVRYVAEPVAGLNRARNTGVGAARHDIVAFVDDDVVVGESWLQAVGAAFEQPAVGCVTGLVLPLELETPAQEEFELYCQHRRDFERHVYSADILRPSAAGVVGMGANMAFRRRLLLELGGFDERFGPPAATRAADETDMFARVLDAGRLIVYVPEAQVWHRHRRSDAEVRRCVFGYGVGVYSLLTKRLVEQRDFGALITAARWLLGPVAKAARARVRRQPAPGWDVVLAETAGAVMGPFCFAYEKWRRRGPLGTPAGRPRTSATPRPEAPEAGPDNCRGVQLSRP